MTKAGGKRVSDFQVGGVESVLEMMRVMDKGSREKLLGLIDGKDPALASQLRQKIFVFADLAGLGAKEAQLLFRTVPAEKLALALRTADPTLTDFVYRNLSERMGKDLRDCLKSMPPRLIRDVEAAQSEILDKAKDLAKDGKLVLKKPGEDTFV